MGLNDLPDAYTRAVNIKGLREELRLMRKRFEWTLDQAAAASGLNRATIHSIENIKREPKLKPELESLESLVNAYGMTLSSFLVKFENRHAAGKSAIGSLGPEVTDDSSVPSAPSDSEDRIARLATRIVRVVIEESTGVSSTRKRAPNSENTKPSSKTAHRKHRARSSDQS